MGTFGRTLGRALGGTLGEGLWEPLGVSSGGPLDGPLGRPWGNLGWAALEDPSGDPRGDPRTVGGIRGRTLGEPWGDPWGEPWKTSGGILGEPCGNSNGLGAWRLKFHSLGRDFQLPRRVASGIARWGAVVGKPTYLLLPFRGNGVRASFADVRGRRGPCFFHGPPGERSPWYPYVLLSCVLCACACHCGVEPSVPKMSPLRRPVCPPMRICNYAPQ